MSDIESHAGSGAGCLKHMLLPTPIPLEIYLSIYRYGVTQCKTKDGVTLSEENELRIHWNDVYDV